jgi:hypothetical protein
MTPHLTRRLVEVIASNVEARIAGDEPPTRVA